MHVCIKFFHLFNRHGEFVRSVMCIYVRLCFFHILCIGIMIETLTLNVGQ